MTDDAANRIYDILVEHAGANDHPMSRREFVAVQGIPGGCAEYRFGGLLGFGGKFWSERGRWRVSCYREDETADRLAVMSRTNVALTRLGNELDWGQPQGPQSPRPATGGP